MTKILSPQETLREIRTQFTRLNDRPSADGHERLLVSLNNFSDAVVLAIMTEDGDLTTEEMDTLDAHFGKISPTDESDEDYLAVRPDRLRHKVLSEREEALETAMKPPLFFKRVVDAEVANPGRLSGISNEVLNLFSHFSNAMLEAAGKLDEREDSFALLGDVLTELRSHLESRGLNYEGPPEDENTEAENLTETETEDETTLPTETPEADQDEAGRESKGDEDSSEDPEEQSGGVASIKKTTIRPRRSKEEVIAELKAMVGLDSVKREVLSLVNVMEVKRLREKHGITAWPRMSLHLVFTGNPGTGKTTVARLIGEAYAAMGVLSNGRFHEVDRSGLIAGYTGQTAIKVNEKCRKAKGGVLFIDEAYSLVRGDDDDFGQEAIAALLKFMEDNREDFVVIVSGYKEDMESFLDSNPGLHSRFNKFIHFEDYTDAQLGSIFAEMCLQNRLEASDAVRKAFAETLVRERKTLEEAGRAFANARTARNVFDKAFFNFCDRVMYLAEHEINAAALTTLQPEDILGAEGLSALRVEESAFDQRQISALSEAIPVPTPKDDSRRDEMEFAVQPDSVKEWSSRNSLPATEPSPEAIFAVGPIPGICDEDCRRPIENLLFTRPLNTLRSHEMDTIGKLLTRMKHGLPKMRNFGEKSERDITRAVHSLRQSVDESGRVDWQSYAQSFARAEGAALIVTAPVTPDIIQLHREDAAISTTRLHFSKAINPLNEAGIVTLGRLIAEPDHNLSSLRNFGKKSMEEVRSAKSAIAESINDAGRIDWDRFAEAEDRILVPESPNDSLLNTMSASCETLLALAPDSPDALILKKRVLPGDGREEDTLDGIARQLNLTRERVRQMELNNIISPLREAFVFDHYTGLSRRLRTGYTDPLHAAHRQLGAATDGTIRTEEEWTRIVADAFGVPPQDADLVNSLPMLRLLLNYERVTFGPTLTRTAIAPAVVTGAERERMRLVVSRLQKILKSVFSPLNESEIMTKWAAMFPGESGVIPSEITRILPFCTFAERTEDRKIRATFEALTIPGQAYRVLEEAELPMHFEEIRSKIRRRLADDTAAESVQSALANSARFTCDGRTGMWRLAGQ